VSWPTTKLLWPLQRSPKANIGKKQLLWAPFHLMPLVYTICTAMCGNGARITGIATMKVNHPPMVVPGCSLKKEKAASELAYCGVVPGTSFRGSAALPIASTIFRTPASASMVFVLCVLPRGLRRSPFLSSTLALYSFFFSLSWRVAPRKFAPRAQALPGCPTRGSAALRRQNLRLIFPRRAWERVTTEDDRTRLS
jgi:hypothetical protein